MRLPAVLHRHRGRRNGFGILLYIHTPFWHTSHHESALSGRSQRACAHATRKAIAYQSITSNLRDGIARLPEGDKDALVEFGIGFALAQCVELLATGVPGLHFYTMDKSRSTAAIVNRLRVMNLL